jgi:cytoskeletal protein CcmA (bactofilin family)
MEVQTETVEEPTVGRGGRHRADNGSAGITLGPRDTLNGKLSIEGDLRVHGTVEGELTASGDVQVEQSANVKATIAGRNVNIRGKVDGPVTAKRRLVLGGSGAINGDVKVSRLTVEDGATLNGNVSMGGGDSEGGEGQG